VFVLPGREEGCEKSNNEEVNIKRQVWIRSALAPIDWLSFLGIFDCRRSREQAIKNGAL
jgi:hypothetical protein